MKTKWYEYTCDVCGAVTHIRGGSNADDTADQPYHG